MDNWFDSNQSRDEKIWREWGSNLGPFGYQISALVSTATVNCWKMLQNSILIIIIIIWLLILSDHYRIIIIESIIILPVAPIPEKAQ